MRCLGPNKTILVWACAYFGEVKTAGLILSLQRIIWGIMSQRQPLWQSNTGDNGKIFVRCLFRCMGCYVVYSPQFCQVCGQLTVNTCFACSDCAGELPASFGFRVRVKSRPGEQNLSKNKAASRVLDQGAADWPFEFKDQRDKHPQIEHASDPWKD